MLDYKVKIGLVPTRRDCSPRPGMFNWEFAENRGREIVKYIEEHYTTDTIGFVDLKGVIDVEVLWSNNDVNKVVEHFRKNGVDAVLIICANFGNEEAVGDLTKKMGKPVLLWAPQDDTFYENGLRMTDSQCGSFAAAKMMHRMNVKFFFVESCFAYDDAFKIGLMRFARVACAVKNFIGMKVGQVGMRPKPFCSVAFNEGQLMEQFDIHVIPINLAVVQSRFNKILEERKEEIAAGADRIRAMYKLDKLSDETAEKTYAFVLMYVDLFKEYDLNAISSECWTGMPILVGVLQCLAYTILSDMGYLIACESDMHAVITQVMLKSFTMGEKVPFLGEFTVRHPTDRNTELLWHCGQFAYSLGKGERPYRVVENRAYFRVKDGHYTVARIDQDHGRYSVIFGECDSADGPFTNGTYLWGKFKDLNKFERKLIEGAYIHHVCEIEGSVSEEIKDFCKYLGNLNADPVDE